MSQITPFVKRMRTQGGTLYTFSSAAEDIGLNINERNNVVKMSHFALLDIPEIKVPEDISHNTFNVFGIDGALKRFDERQSILDGKIIVAESFQNYALNLENTLLSEDDYNPVLLKTVSERVFWKWLKETGAIRWTKDSSNPGYWIEEPDTDNTYGNDEIVEGYRSVVKYIGEISAGSIRTNTFGTFNETYILVPTSHGQTRVYFKQNYDDNYKSNYSLTNNDLNNILGRENYTKPHPDGLDFQAHYDIIDSSVEAGPNWDLEVDKNDNNGYTAGWWYTAQGQSFNSGVRGYTTDSSIILNDPSTYNYKLRATSTEGVIEFQRSNVDAIEVELNIDKLRDIYNDSTLTYDKMAIEESMSANIGSVDDSFNFNAVLLYYTVYNNTLDKILSTNLLGILFLDPAVGNTSGFPEMEIEIPQLSKLQSTTSGFGSSYSFRVNVKSDNMIDDTQAVIYDESTSAQTVLENWVDIFGSLEKSLSILNQQTGTINYITNQYKNISSIQTQQANALTDIQEQINDVIINVKGTPNTIPLFAGGEDPLVDSSIYMNNGNIGVFTTEPSVGFHINDDLQTKDIIIENAIRDTSGNILLGYGSPLQIGSSTNNRQIDFYVGNENPIIKLDSSLNTYFAGDVSISGQVNISSNLSIFSNGSENIRLTKDGSAYFSNVITENWTAPSDIRLKTDVKYINDAFSKINLLQGVSFKKIKTGDFHFGFIAQDVENIIPEVVKEIDLPFEGEDGVKYKTINYIELIPHLVESIKELKIEINDLKEEINILKNN